MATHNQLPIYKVAYDLLDAVTDFVKNMQRDFGLSEDADGEANAVALRSAINAAHYLKIAEECGGEITGGCAFARAAASPWKLPARKAVLIMAEMKPVAWADDITLRGSIGLCEGAATKAYWIKCGNQQDRAAAERMRHPLFTADQLAQARREGIETAARLCGAADKSTHPADLADAIRSLQDLEGE